VIDYLVGAGIDVVDSISLNVTDNGVVGRLDPADLIDHAERLDLRRAEAIVLSACVQMPSLASIPIVEGPHRSADTLGRGRDYPLAARSPRSRASNSRRGRHSPRLVRCSVRYSDLRV